MVLKKTSFQDGKCVQFMSTSNTCSNISISGYVHDDSTPKLHFTLLHFAAASGQTSEVRRVHVSDRVIGHSETT